MRSIYIVLYPFEIDNPHVFFARYALYTSPILAGIRQLANQPSKYISLASLNDVFTFTLSSNNFHRIPRTGSELK